MGRETYLYVHLGEGIHKMYKVQQRGVRKKWFLLHM